jgi:hypothetical protein
MSPFAVFRPAGWGSLWRREGIVELTSTEAQLLELLQEKDAEAQRQSQHRMLRFLTSISERTGIAVEAIRINPETGEIGEMRPETNGNHPEEAALSLSESS